MKTGKRLKQGYRLYLDLSDDCTAKESEIDSLEMDRGRAKVHVELLEYHLVDARVELDGCVFQTLDRGFGS